MSFIDGENQKAQQKNEPLSLIGEESQKSVDLGSRIKNGEAQLPNTDSKIGAKN